MTNEFSLEEYIKDLSPELQEKARECKTMEELNAFLAENELELPEDALEMVSGGCSAQDSREEGYIFKNACPDCGADLRYHDDIYVGISQRIRAHCVVTNIRYLGKHAKDRGYDRDDLAWTRDPSW